VAKPTIDELEAQHPWLRELREIAESLENGTPLPGDDPEPSRPRLLVIEGGRDG
jgi:hypothetical protein